MRTVLMILTLIALSACSITAERYKVPTMSAWTGGNPERVAAYECQDGYYKARDHRGVLWCDSSDERLEYYTRVTEPARCDGVTITHSWRPDDCVEEGAVGGILIDALGDAEAFNDYDE